VANVVRFTLSTARDLHVPGAGAFIDGVLDVDANDLELVSRTRFLVQPFRAVEIGIVDSATPPPTLPAVPGPPAPDPYPQYTTEDEIAISPAVQTAALLAVEQAANVEPTGLWDFEQTPTVDGSPLGTVADSVPDAAAGVKGVIRLTGDLGGTAASPTVAAGVSAPTVSALVRRDAAGRFQAVAGSAAADVVVKSQLDAAGTASPTASTVVRRDAAGRFQAVAASAAADVVIKSSMDAMAATKLDGINTPEKKTITGDLWVEREFSTGLAEADFSGVGYGIVPVIHGRSAEGTKALPTAKLAGLIWGIGSRPWTGTEWTAHSPAAIHWIAEQNISDVNHGTFMRFWATANGATQASRIPVLDLKSSPAGGGRLESDFSSVTQLARTLFRTSVPNSGTSVGCVPNIDTAHAQWNAFGLLDPTNSPYIAIKATATSTEVISGVTGTGTQRPLNLVVGATTAASFGTDGNLDKLLVPTAQAVKVAAQALTTATWTPVNFVSEAYDNNAMHDNSTNTTRMVAPHAGKYRFTSTLFFLSNATGVRMMSFRVNGDANGRWGYQATTALGSSLGTGLTSSCEIDLAANDYVEVCAYQSSGGNLDIEAEGVQPGRGRFTMTYIGA
jgi:hypothetical protein